MEKLNLPYAILAANTDFSCVINIWLSLYIHKKFKRNFLKELKEANRQGIAILNTLITVGGAFAFGFFGLHMAYPHLQMELATRMLLGLLFATIVFFADLYFIIKNMSVEEDTIQKKELWYILLNKIVSNIKNSV